MTAASTLAIAVHVLSTHHSQLHPAAASTFECDTRRGVARISRLQPPRSCAGVHSSPETTTQTYSEFHAYQSPTINLSARRPSRWDVFNIVLHFFEANSCSIEMRTDERSFMDATGSPGPTTPTTATPPSATAAAAITTATAPITAVDACKERGPLWIFHVRPQLIAHLCLPWHSRCGGPVEGVSERPIGGPLWIKVSTVALIVVATATVGVGAVAVAVAVAAAEGMVLVVGVLTPGNSAASIVIFHDIPPCKFSVWR